MTSAHYSTVFSTNLSNASVNPGRVKALPIGDGAGAPMGDQLRNLNIKKARQLSGSSYRASG